MARGLLVLDAAMGTRLIARGLDLSGDDPSLWNLSHPEVVRELHARDVAAGSDAVVTNTFGANRHWLARYGRAGEVAAINRRAVELAREAAGPGRFVLGSIGPTASEVPGAAREQAEALAGSGVDALLFETHTLEQAERALERSAAPSPSRCWSACSTGRVRRPSRRGGWPISGRRPSGQTASSAWSPPSAWPRPCTGRRTSP